MERGAGGGGRYGYRTCLRAVKRSGVKHGRIRQISRREVASRVKEFISQTPMGVHETSIKEHLTNFTTVRHGNKQKKANAYNKRKQTPTTKSHVFPKQTKNNKNNKKPEKGRS